MEHITTIRKTQVLRRKTLTVSYLTRGDCNCAVYICISYVMLNYSKIPSIRVYFLFCFFFYIIIITNSYSYIMMQVKLTDYFIYFYSKCYKIN